MQTFFLFFSIHILPQRTDFSFFHLQYFINYPYKSYLCSSYVHLFYNHAKTYDNNKRPIGETRCGQTIA